MIIETDLDLTPYNSYRINSVASIAYFPESKQELLNLIQSQSNYIVIGGGCNIVLSKERYDDTIFIILRENYSGIETIDNKIRCLAGTDLMSLSLYALEKGFTGLEIYYDIPGSVGGAVVMNAGAKGEDIAHLIEEVEVYDTELGKIINLNKEELGYDYRNSLFLNNSKLIVLSATFGLQSSDRQKIREKMESNKLERWKKQPREYPSAGSVFKRPIGIYVGPMIEKLGLKGYRIGGAEVSTKHAGFIVNKGNATGTDIVMLIGYIKERVMAEFNIMLETEQRIIL